MLWVSFLFLGLIPTSAVAAIGALSLDSTLASVSVTLVAARTDYAESDLVLEYQKQGSDTWNTGHSLAKIDSARFIGSLFFLAEGTVYTVRVGERGCQDASCRETAQVSTRTALFPSGSGSVYFVAPGGSDSNPGTEALPLRTVSKAESVSQPGSVIRIKAGTYYESITVDRSGTPDAYIKYVGEPGARISGADPAYDVVDTEDDWVIDETTGAYKTQLGYRTHFVGFNGTSRVFNYRQKNYTLENFAALSLTGIDCGYWSGDDGWLYVKLPGGIDPDTVTMQIGQKHRGFLVSNASYLVFENLEIGHFGNQSTSSSASAAIEVRHGSNIVVQKCRIHHAYYGIIIQNNDSHDNLVQDNEIFDDPAFMKWPWSSNKAHDTEITAVALSAGGGSVVRNNNIHHVFNGVSPGTWGRLADETYNFNLDIYGNQMQEIGDDCVEPEGANINTRIWNNTCKDIHMGISLAPITVGPVYVIRNKILNYSKFDKLGASLKYANGGTYGGFGRIYVYHNTAYTTNNVNTLTTIGDIGNMVYRNNIFYGDRYAFENYIKKMAVPVDWDYDCLYTRNTQRSPYYISAYWYGIDQKVNAKDLAAFRTATGQEIHGSSADPLFVDVNNYNIDLRENSPCRDGGVIIPGINETNYAGAAPDMGAVEYGMKSVVAAPSRLRIAAVITPSDPPPDPQDPPDDPGQGGGDTDPPDPGSTGSFPSLPIGNWVKTSPTAEHKSAPFGWEGSGSFDPYHRLWIHDAGHDVNGVVQGFALWTWDVAKGGWKVRFPDDAPPGTCVVQGAATFDTANKRYFKTIGAYLSHGHQWIRSVNLRGPHIWLYDVAKNEWTDALPESQYDRMNQGLDTKGMARMAVAATYAEDQQAIFTFGGMGWVASNNQLHVYDPYTNELTRLDPTGSKPLARDNAGLSYDESRRKILMFGSQYDKDEKTHIYDLATNAWTSHDLSPRPHSTPADYNTDRYASVPNIAYDPIHDKHLAVTYRGKTAAEGVMENGSLKTWSFDMGKMQWSELAPADPYGTGCVQVRGRNLAFSPRDNAFLLETMYLDECSTSKKTNDLWVYRYSDSGSYVARPEAPVATTTDKTVALSWKAVAGATQYNVYRATGKIPNLNFSKIGSTAAVSYTDSNVTPGVVYYYRYAAVLGGVERKQSLFGRNQPRVMRAPIVSARSDYKVDVSWTPHQDSDVVGYNLYRGLVTVHTNTTIGETLDFSQGTSRFVNGEVIRQGAVSATVSYVVLKSGSWGSNATGYFALIKRTGGNFIAGAVTGAISGVAVATGAQKKVVNDSRLAETVFDGYTRNVVNMVRNITGLTKINTNLITGTAYTDSGINLSVAGPESADYPFAVYAYVIKAVNRFGVESGSSPYRITIPSAPTHVLMNTATKTLQWDAPPEKSVQGYYVYQYAGTAPVKRLTNSLVASPYVLPAATYNKNDRFWVVPVDLLGQEGTPSADIYYGDHYAGFHDGVLHQ